MTFGNFIGDFIKGKKVELLSGVDEKGVRLHRSIDFFTDQHDLTKQVKRFFSPEFGLLSSVLVDMYFDHVLAKNWKDFSNISLQDFSQTQFNILDTRVTEMPEMCAYMYEYFKNDNWLMRYQTLSGTLQSLKGMTRRFNLKYDLETSEAIFIENETVITERFYAFISDIDKSLDR